VDIIFPAADSAAAGKILTNLLLLSNEIVLVVLVVAREKASDILPRVFETRATTKKRDNASVSFCFFF